MLSWTQVPKEKRNGIITGYIIEAVGSDSSYRHTEEAKADATSIEICNLSPFTEYTFKVSAKTKVGPGPAAEKQSKTPEGGEIYCMVS